MRLGDGLFTLGLWGWMMARVGPWWVGVILFLVGMLFNSLEETLNQQRKHRHGKKGL